jgi:hypothetical protein
MKTKKQAPAPPAKKAASAAKSSRGGDTRELVLEAIRGGADNCSKIAKLTGVSSVTVGSYIKKLATEKNVTVTGAFSSFKVVPY